MLEGSVICLDDLYPNVIYRGAICPKRAWVCPKTRIRDPPGDRVDRLSDGGRLLDRCNLRSWSRGCRQYRGMYNDRWSRRRAQDGEELRDRG
jgi:hypothetical protein